MKDISKEIIGRIKGEHVVPESRFRLLWKSYLFWLLMVFMLAVGALSFSLVIFNLIDFDPRFFRHMEILKFVRTFASTAPYLWIAVSMLAIVFGVLAFRNTEHGYRQSALFITSLAVLSVSVLAFSSHFLKIDRLMRDTVSRNVPGFKGFMDNRSRRWIRPNDGLVGGEITVLEDGKDFVIRSLDDREWNVTYDDDTELIDADSLAIGDRVGVIGRKTGNSGIYAFSIRVMDDDWDELMPVSGSGRPGGFPDSGPDRNAIPDGMSPPAF